MTFNAGVSVICVIYSGQVEQFIGWCQRHELKEKIVWNSVRQEASLFNVSNNNIDSKTFTPQQAEQDPLGSMGFWVG